MTEYYRLSGGGNDFLALVEPPRPPAEAEVRAWCSRGLSLGADGLFVLRHAAFRHRMAATPRRGAGGRPGAAAAKLPQPPRWT